MKLKKEIDYGAFIHAVQNCRGEVFFSTAAGDRLNLKSMLSEFLFVSAAVHSDLLDGGEVLFEEDTDIDCVKKFLEEA